ncbi:MAG TPA: 2-phospho-L-lactate transferase CofD family protein, partial [Acidimicrobiales bacterium]|nr:2-phospho-L-lactate transferase CofD family protein [Acidimicrobiales bacterium]
LLLLALTEELGDLQSACDEVARIAGIDLGRTRIVPVTDDAVVLHGRTGDGAVVAGQVAVAGTEGIEEVWVDPSCTAASPLAVRAIAEADLVVLGPGSLYTSVLAAAVVGDVRKALVDTAARVAYVGNLRADGAETRGYDLADHVAALRRHGIHPDVEVPSDGLARPDGLAHDPALLGSVLQGLVA